MAKDKAERILILGAGVMQGPAIRIAGEMGLETVVVDGDPNAPCASMADRFVHIDLKDKEGIEALARSLKADGGLGGVMTAGTDFSASVAWVAEKLGLSGIPYEAALNASDKERMRRCFKEAGVASPAFMILKSPPPPDFSLPFAYPAVVKPVDNMGSRGCRRVDSGPELAAAAKDALGFSRSGRAIVEEYMEGPEFSVDAIVYHGEITICGLADRHIFFPPYFIEMGHTMPASLDGKTAGALLETFRAGVRALGLAGPESAGAAKGDLKLTAKGPMIGEIAARLSGGYMSGWTYPYSSGVEPARGAILAALGRSPQGLLAEKNWTSAERAVISIPGKVRSIYTNGHGRGEALSIEYVKDLFMRAAAGSRVRFPENNVTKCGNVISAAPGREAAVAAAERAARSVLIRLDAPDRETDAFLGFEPSISGSLRAGGFPPDAFALPEDLAARLAALPDPPCPSGESPETALSLYPFPELTGSGLSDYTGRTIAESLEAVRTLTGLPLPVAVPALAFPGKTAPGAVLGRFFWAAFVRGGYQGAAYTVDRFLQTRKIPEVP